MVPMTRWNRSIAIMAAKIPKNSPQFLLGNASSTRNFWNQGGMTLIGNHFGDKLFAKVDERTFRRIALFLLFAIGISTIGRGLVGSGAAH